MSLLNQLSQIGKNLAELGQAKMMALGGVGALSVMLIIAAAVFLNKPAQETLYIGLSGEDINQISLVLAESNIDFATGSDGSSITVPAGLTNRARMLLAERGLPSSNTAGYELFDQVGSLGLTSFMQEVTRVRALEGEIARTIQSINGISAARVHIVMADRGNFRRGEQQPSASVMVRTGNNLAPRTANSIRHLVASSVPGLNVDEVTVLDATGQLLATGDDFSNSNLNRSLSIVQLVQNEVETNIEKALAPFLGIENFRASVTAKVNTDSQQIQETVYDPESRVERSTRITRENQTSNQSATETRRPSSRTYPIRDPMPAARPDRSPASLPSARKSRPTTRSIRRSSPPCETATASRACRSRSSSTGRGSTKCSGGDPTEEQTAAYLAELQQVVTTASGVDTERGDRANITVMEFLASELLTADAAQSGFGDVLKTHLGTIINALAFITVAVLLIMFGFRPLLGGGKAGKENEESWHDDGLELPDFSPAALGGGGHAHGRLRCGFRLWRRRRFGTRTRRIRKPSTAA
jgi:flagellar M-ring protein FliF